MMTMSNRGQYRTPRKERLWVESSTNAVLSVAGQAGQKFDDFLSDAFASKYGRNFDKNVTLDRLYVSAIIYSSASLPVTEVNLFYCGAYWGPRDVVDGDHPNLQQHDGSLPLHKVTPTSGIGAAGVQNAPGGLALLQFDSQGSRACPGTAYDLFFGWQIDSAPSTGTYTVAYDVTALFLTS